MDANQHISEMLDRTISSLKSMVDIDCMVGKAVKNDFGDVIVPISKVTVGIVAGGGEYPPLKRSKKRQKDDDPFIGAIGSGMTIAPVGFLIVSKDNVRYINSSGENNLSRILDIAVKFYKSYKKE